MQQKALVAILGLVLVVSVGFALTRMAGGGAAAYQSDTASMSTAAEGESCSMSAEEMKDCGGCPSGGEKAAGGCPITGGEEKVETKPIEDIEQAPSTEIEAKPTTES